jgi:hypothetical protein
MKFFVIDQEALSRLEEYAWRHQITLEALADMKDKRLAPVGDDPNFVVTMPVIGDDSACRGCFLDRTST